jgi:heptosyltransferase-2
VKFLVIGPAWVGDMVMAQSLFRVLVARSGGAVIDVVAPPWSGPLLARMPEVRSAIALDVAHGELGFAKRWRLGRSLRAEAYDHAIVLPRSAKSALVPFFAAAKRRTGYRAELRALLLTDVRDPDLQRLDQTVKRFVALGLDVGASLPEPLPRPALRIDERNRAAVLARLQLDSSRPVVALLPGAAYGPAKQWPISSFAMVAQSAMASGAAVWVLGSAAEKELGQHIVGIAGSGVRNLCGETRLEDTVDLLSLARSAVANDSGLMHVAAAAGTHVIAIYGSSSPTYTPPLAERATIHYLGLECSPCFKRECPLGHLRCLREISASDVWKSLEIG